MVLRFVVILLSFLPGHHGYLWSSTLPPSGVKYVCSGGTAVLPWSLMINPQEEIMDIQWFREKTMLAIFSRGSFFTMPGLGNRLSPIHTGGIALNNVTSSDTGNYSVEVTGRSQNGSLFTLHGQVFVHVYDETLQQNKSLTIRQEDNVVCDNTTGQWSVHLTCGPFSFFHHPPFHVHWATPSAVSSNSSSYYKDGYFHLLIGVSEASGTFSCRVPDHSHCPNAVPVPHPASTSIDTVKARLAMLEAKLTSSSGGCQASSTSQSLDQVIEANNRLVEQNALLKAQKTQLDRQASRLTESIGMLSNKNAILSSQVSLLEDRFKQLNRSHSVQAGVATTCMQDGGDCSSVNQTLKDADQMFRQEVSFVQDQVQNQTSQLVKADEQMLHVNQTLHGINEQIEQLKQKDVALQNGVEDLEKNVSRIHSSPNVCFHARKYHDQWHHQSYHRSLRHSFSPMGMLPVNSFFNMPDLHHMYLPDIGDAGHGSTNPGNSHSMHSDNMFLPDTPSSFIHNSTLSFPYSVTSPGQSHVYDNTHSVFTAPYTGTYFFQVSTSVRNRPAAMTLMSSDMNVLDYVRVVPQNGMYLTPMSSHAVVHLHRGERVWVQAYHEMGSEFWSASSAFSGCLISQD